MITQLILLGLFCLSVVLGGVTLSGLALAMSKHRAMVKHNVAAFRVFFEQAETLVDWTHPDKEQLLKYFAVKYSRLERTEDEVRGEFVKFLYAEQKHLG